MKLTKSLFLAFAGLGLFACSNEDVADNGGGKIDGPATVNVRLSLPEVINNLSSRSGEGMNPQTPTSGSIGSKAKVVINSLKVVLHAVEGGGPKIVEVQDGQNLQQFTNIKFTGVLSPQSIEVFVNQTDEDDDITTGNLTIDRINTAGLAAPLYAEVLATDDDDTDGCSFIVSKTEKNTYDAHITPQPRYARLELSNITHDNDHSDAGCMFKRGTLLGVYLNDLNTTEKGDGKTSVQWSKVSTSGYPSPTWSLAGNEDNSWITSSNVWPSGGLCYAYSVFNKPQTVFAMNNVLLNDGFVIADDEWTNTDTDKDKVWYAIVTKYVLNDGVLATLSPEQKMAYGVNDEGEITTFKPGNIYKITNIAIPDKAWSLGDKDPEIPPTPPTKVNVIATVDILPWVVVDGTVDWN